MDFYEVRFLDSRDSQIHPHFVYTADMEVAKRRIETEEPYVKVVSWKRIKEEDLPMLAIVIQK